MRSYAVIALVTLVVLLLAGLALVAPRLRRRPPEAAPPAAPPKVAAPEVAAPPQAAAPPQVVAPPELEVPEPTAGRLVRLRARLARSQNVFGKSLLALLARDRLDDETWDEV